MQHDLKTKGSVIVMKYDEYLNACLKFANCWSSDYYIEYGYGDARNVWYNWGKCKAKFESESETDEAI